MKGIIAGVAVTLVAVFIGVAVLAPDLLKGDTAGTPSLGIPSSDVTEVLGIQTHTGDLTVGFDHVDKYEGVALTDDTDVDVDIWTIKDDGTYKLKKHSTSGQAIVGINPTITTLYIVPSEPDNDFYFSPDDAVEDNPRIANWFFDDITGDGNADYVLVTNALDLDSLGKDSDGNPKFTIDLTWLDYTIPTSFLVVGSDTSDSIGTGSKTTNVDVALLLTEGDSVGIEYIEWDFNGTIADSEWDEDTWCTIVPEFKKICLNNSGMDRDKFTSNTVYTYEFGGKDFNDLLYVPIKKGGDTSPEFEITAATTFTAATDATQLTITIGYQEADGDNLTTSTVEVLHFGG